MIRLLIAAAVAGAVLIVVPLVAGAWHRSPWFRVSVERPERNVRVLRVVR